MTKIDKPDCLEGQAHIWVFPTGTGSTKIFGARSAGGSFYDGSEVRINYKRTATCRICDQTYTFEGIRSPYDVQKGRQKTMDKNAPRKKKVKHVRYDRRWQQKKHMKGK